MRNLKPDNIVIADRDEAERVSKTGPLFLIDVGRDWIRYTEEEFEDMFDGGFYYRRSIAASNIRKSNKNFGY